MDKYPQDHEIVNYVLSVQDLEEITTYGGDDLQTFSNEQIDLLSEEIKDVQTGERISKFRARKRADVDRMLQMASIGLKRPLSDFEAVYLTDWE